MKRWLLRIALALAVVVAGGLAWFVVQLDNRPSLAPQQAHWLATAAPAPGRLKVTYLGVASLLFDDGETALMTDGFFSRPGLLAVLVGRVAPDTSRIEAGLRAAGVQRLAAVIPVHSHYDHAMDAPEVARRTGAQMVGSQSTANIARGAGLTEDRIQVVRDGQTLRFGRFEVTFLHSVHAPTDFTGGEVTAPLVPPARALAYKEGVSYSLLIRHDGRSLLVQGSAGYVPGLLKGHMAEVVFLGVGTLGKLPAAHREAYWRETVGSVGARRVIPIHWDDFTLPIAPDIAMLPMPRLADDFDATMAFLLASARARGVEVKLVPAYVGFDPFASLP